MNQETVAEILSLSERGLRERLIDLVNAGANSAVLYSFVSAIGGVENARRGADDPFEEDEE